MYQRNLKCKNIFLVSITLTGNKFTEVAHSYSPIGSDIGLYLYLPATPFCFVSVSPAGFHSLCISSALLLLCAGLGAPLGYLFELMLPLAMCAIAVSFLFSVYLYARSFCAPPHALALGGNTGECKGCIVR